MVYIPKEWLINPDNEKKINQLFDEYFPDTCILHSEVLEKQKEFPAKLKELGETEVLKHFLDRDIIVTG